MRRAVGGSAVVAAAVRGIGGASLLPLAVLPLISDPRTWSRALRSQLPPPWLSQIATEDVVAAAAVSSEGKEPAWGGRQTGWEGGGAGGGSGISSRPRIRVDSSVADGGTAVAPAESPERVQELVELDVGGFGGSLNARLLKLVGRKGSGRSRSCGLSLTSDAPMERYRDDCCG